MQDRWQEQATDFYRSTGALGLSLLNGNFLRSTSDLVVRRSVFEGIRGFDESPYAHDLHFFLMLVSTGNRMTILKDSSSVTALVGATPSPRLTRESEHSRRPSSLLRSDLLRNGSPTTAEEVKDVFRILERHRLRPGVEGLLAAMRPMNGAANSSLRAMESAFAERLVSELEGRP